MIVSLFTKEKLYTVSLPAKASGRYWVTDKDAEGHLRHVANIEGIQGQWVLHDSRFLALFNAEGKETQAITLSSNMQVIKAQYRKDQSTAQFYIEPVTDDRQHFQKYQVRENCRLNIGRTSDNQIVYDNQYVSAHHACLVWQGGQWSVTDTQSGNGTFVNESRIATRQLLPGDMVCILGLKIIFGKGFFAINNPDGMTHIAPGAAALLTPQKMEPRSTDHMELPETLPFSPAPTLHRQVEQVEIRVDAPPNAQKVEETPLALLLGPAITMGMTAVVMAVVAINNYSTGAATLATIIPTLVMSFSMLCGTLLWPTLTRRSEKKKRIRQENARQKKYEEYLGQIRGQLFQIGEEQKAILLDNYPSVLQCMEAVKNRSSRLWERESSSKDFLTIRLGTGTVPVNVSIRFPEQRFALDDDALQNMAYRMAGEERVVDQAPVVCSLITHAVVGITGSHDETENYLSGIIMQLAALHSSEDLKLVFLAGDRFSEKWHRFRLLPHTWDIKENVHYWASNEEDGKVLTSALEKVISERLERQNSAGNAAEDPHYVFVVSDLAYAERINIFREVIAENRCNGFSCIIMAQNIAALPRECSMVMQLREKEISIFDRKKPEHLMLTAYREQEDEDSIENAVEELANLNSLQQDQSSTLPNMLTFLEMFQSGKVEHLNALTRWRDNNPVISLQTPIGINADGSIFYLDLHEKHHGPHGLVAGMTGSGKSELIITFILSMAVNYHPDEVSFILIDYKGGGLAGAFENPLTGVRLPHLAGTITNLDGAAVNRALISIQSELRRRQAIFNKARQVSGEGTIDIYKYQKMYRNGLLDTPVPHLFIISDEFAELKAQQPEFMAQLISTARIGRSLGVHLILATQKPSGVVDDQIWSNSRFRVCLKVQERADSMEMLKRPDAAELSETGRFYLQVGFNELFELGQSAWCGAPYYPADQVLPKRDDSVEVLDNLGQVLAEAAPKTKEAREEHGSQIISVVSYLTALAKEEHASAKQLWLPPIPERIYLDELKKNYGWEADPVMLNPVLGEYDDPFTQSKGLLTLPLSQNGNAILYGAAGSGKGLFLETVLCGLLQTYSAENLNVYIMDLGEETLRVFEKAPQVGDVLTSVDSEKIQNLFKMLESEISTRKKRFAQADGDFYSYCKSTGKVLPHILVVLRNYSAFYEQFELLDAVLTQITRECSKYGIYFLLTANAANAVRYRLAQNFSNTYALQLNDKTDYTELFGRTDGVYPSNLKGRGIFKSDRIYEFQTAHFAQDAGLSAIRDLVNQMTRNTEGYAPCVPHLPERVTVDSFADEIIPAEFPVGVEKATLRRASIDLTRSPITLLSGQDKDELAIFVQGVVEQLCRLPSKIAVLDGAGQLEMSENFSYEYVHGNFSGCVLNLFREMVQRNNSYKTAIQGGKSAPKFVEMCYVITGLKVILASLDDDGRDKLRTLLEHAETTYSIRFVLCDNAQDLREFTSEPWYKKHVSGTEGVWVGDGIAEQYVLRLGAINSALYSEIPPHFGYVVKKGRPILTKLLEQKGEEGLK